MASSIHQGARKTVLGLGTFVLTLLSLPLLFLGLPGFLLVVGIVVVGIWLNVGIKMPKKGGF